MKKILITGKNSYIGTSVKNWLLKTPDQYEVDTVDLRNPDWVSEDFSKYNVILHVAGIAHVSKNKKNKDLYFKVNTELTLRVAKKAELEGVSHFIFMSSIIIYGSKNDVISKNTKPNPDDFYGKSKLLAENGLKELQSKNFKVAIIRPPMIYGKESKGNYRRLAKLVRFIPVFPDYQNQRSMLHIDNLCEFLKFIIEDNAFGTFYPQNEEYVSTSNLVKEISIYNKRKILFLKFFNPAITYLLCIDLVRKLFGNMIYEKDISIYEKYNYQIRNFKESVRLTENGE